METVGDVLSVDEAQLLLVYYLNFFSAHFLRDSGCQQKGAKLIIVGVKEVMR